MTLNSKLDLRIYLLNLVFFIFSMARSASDQWFIVYFYDYFNIWQCQILFGCKLGVRFVASIIWGFWGDYYSNQKLNFFIVTHIISAVLSSLFLYKYVMMNFSISMIIILFDGFVVGTAALLDTVTVLIVPENTYGKTRFWWAFGVGVGALLCGIWAHYSLSNMVYFYFYGIAIAITCIVLMISITYIPNMQIHHNIDTDHNTDDDTDDEHSDNSVLLENDDKDSHINNSQNNNTTLPFQLVKEFFSLMCCNNIVIIFNIDLFIFGIAHAFVQQALFIYLLNVFNATKYLCGLTIFSMISGELIIFYFSEHLLKKIGIIGLLGIAHFSYAFRVILYTVIPHYRSWSYLFLLLEPLHGFTFAGMWIASVEYGSRISPLHLKATTIGTIKGIYNGFGNMCGTLLTGYLYYTIGPDIMFRSCGIVVLIWALFCQIVFRVMHYSHPTKYTTAIF
eukprot:356527_1